MKNIKPVAQGMLQSAVAAGCVCVCEHNAKIRVIAQNRHSLPGSEEKQMKERLFSFTMVSPSGLSRGYMILQTVS